MLSMVEGQDAVCEELLWIHRIVLCSLPTGEVEVPVSL
jgi:hypothetical protein